ncbi:hypothetical protein AK812_SmicGene4684 [Symbiodinium microadriaticum]|uniref:Uncharacterized protein n=1 Tax=Symbiodinium microadriaticum TaxID=2951 RepID=A0A1Q9EVS4_SYMMI|nr:hypothetical protein AK812_SmicGene4684 [Symbiodinium microadriaticum]
MAPRLLPPTPRRLGLAAKEWEALAQEERLTVTQTLRQQGAEEALEKVQTLLLSRRHVGSNKKAAGSQQKQNPRRDRSAKNGAKEPARRKAVLRPREFVEAAEKEKTRKPHAKVTRIEIEEKEASEAEDEEEEASDEEDEESGEVQRDRSLECKTGVKRGLSVNTEIELDESEQEEEEEEEEDDDAEEKPREVNSTADNHAPAVAARLSAGALRELAVQRIQSLKAMEPQASSSSSSSQPAPKAQLPAEDSSSSSSGEGTAQAATPIVMEAGNSAAPPMQASSESEARQKGDSDAAPKRGQESQSQHKPEPEQKQQIKAQPQTAKRLTLKAPAAAPAIRRKRFLALSRARLDQGSGGELVPHGAARSEALASAATDGFASPGARLPSATCMGSRNVAASRLAFCSRAHGRASYGLGCTTRSFSDDATTEGKASVTWT